MQVEIEKAAKENVAESLPKFDGLRYNRMLKRMHIALKPSWYLEVGTFSGKSLALANCNIVAVDPKFKIRNPVINSTGKELFFFQQTSDDFFAMPFLARNKIRFDFAFLDGLHKFEFLLRDFMNAEKVMANGGVIALHDCCPGSYDMAVREQRPGKWTGDVWKTLLILLRYRPDLDIQVANSQPTGLVVVRNLDPNNQVLDKNYDDLLAEYSPMTLEKLDGGLAGLYGNFEVKSPKLVLESLGFEN